MAAPITGALDTFNAGAAQLLTARAGWGPGPIFVGDASLTTDAGPTYATNSAGSFNDNWWTTTSWADVECWITFGSVVNDCWLYARLKDEAAGADGYELEWLASGAIRLSSLTNAAQTQLVTGTQVASPGDSIALVCVGTSIQGWYKAGAGAWVLKISATDATWGTNGHIGLSNQSTNRVDSFGGGAAAAGTGAGSMGLLGVGR